MLAMLLMQFLSLLKSSTSNFEIHAWLPSWGPHLPSSSADCSGHVKKMLTNWMWSTPTSASSKSSETSMVVFHLFCSSPRTDTLTQIVWFSFHVKDKSNSAGKVKPQENAVRCQVLWKNIHTITRFPLDKDNNLLFIPVRRQIAACILYFNNQPEEIMSRDE